MAQYDVYVNPNLRSRESIPYIVDVQSALLDKLRTRLTIPLARVATGIADAAPRRLSPRLVVSGESLSLQAHLTAPLEARLLRKPVATLAAQAHDIVGALDSVLSGV